jgi:hypothetical protein
MDKPLLDGVLAHLERAACEMIEIKVLAEFNNDFRPFLESCQAIEKLIEDLHKKIGETVSKITSNDDNEYVKLVPLYVWNTIFMSEPIKMDCPPPIKLILRKMIDKASWVRPGDTVCYSISEPHYAVLLSYCEHDPRFGFYYQWETSRELLSHAEVISRISPDLVPYLLAPIQTSKDYWEVND